MLNTAPTVEQIRAAACTWRLTSYERDGELISADEFGDVGAVARHLIAYEGRQGGASFFELLGLLPKAPGTSVDAEHDGVRMVLTRAN